MTRVPEDELVRMWEAGFSAPCAGDFAVWAGEVVHRALAEPTCVGAEVFVSTSATELVIITRWATAVPGSWNEGTPPSPALTRNDAWTFRQVSTHD